MPNETAFAQGNNYMVWFWIYAMMVIAFALIISMMAIDLDIAAQRDKTRKAWWPRGKDRDECKRRPVRWR